MAEKEPPSDFRLLVLYALGVDLTAEERQEIHDHHKVCWLHGEFLLGSFGDAMRPISEFPKPRPRCVNKLLKEHSDATLRTNFPEFISEFEALLEQALQRYQEEQHQLA